MRLDKYIAHGSGHSRSEVHKALKAGEVTVNGVVEKKAATSVSANDQVILGGQRIGIKKPCYLMLHKPPGFICATQDSQQPTVIDLIHEPGKSTLQIVGRLDKDTTGLVLLTDDGIWNHAVSSPRRGCAKAYIATLAHPVTQDDQHHFAAGIRLKGESKSTLPAQLQLIPQAQAVNHGQTETGHRVRVIISEGKYHQVKRMFAAIGNHVLSLHRESIGTVPLDIRLQPGDYRHLTAEEVLALRAGS